jgi:hypothetical protein
MAKITNEQKLEALKAWLKENNIAFVENHESRFGMTIDIKIPNLAIAIFLSDGNKEKEDAIYNAKSGHMKLYHVYKPFFIRESETKEFILEKIQNCCFERMVWLQKRFEKNNK